MSLRTLLNQPLTIERWGPSTTDTYGNQTVVKASEYTTVGYLEQTDAVEFTVDRETYVSNWLLVLPELTLIDGGDRVRYGTATYEVIGQPARLSNPRTKREDHCECRLRLVTG